MKKNNVSITLVAILLITVMTMCTKSETPEELVPSVKAAKGMFLTKSFTDSVTQNKELALKMSNDVDWKALKSNSQECLAILIAKNIDLHDESNFNSETFYRRLGNDAQVYKEKMLAGKEHAKAFMKRYFPNLNQCSSCNVVDPTKKLAYATALDAIRIARNQKNMNTAPTISAELEDGGAPNCWNVEFFACGGLCALTIELPPAFALCMALCVVEYCTPG